MTDQKTNLAYAVPLWIIAVCVGLMTVMAITGLIAGVALS